MLALGCSGASDEAPAQRAAGATGGSGGSGPSINLGGSGGSTPGAGTTGTTGAGTSGTGSGDACTNTDFAGCVGELYEGENLTLDMYVMFDQSGSMHADVGGLTRLQAVQRAAETFLNDPESAHIGVGIGYFGFQEVGKVSCDASTYEAPDVGVTLEHAEVIASLDNRMPVGETPTAAAIDGACSYATSFRQQNPGHSVVILLVTDGIPEAPASCASGGCCPSLDDAVAAARSCAHDGFGIRTYVLGVGPELDNLNQIAAAGETEHAYLVGDKDVSASVLAALDSIRGAAIPCELEIPQPPPGQPLDFGEVNVLVGKRDCSVPFSPIYYVDDASGCDAQAGGWYYDDPDAPAHVELCDASCAAVSQPEATLRFSVGCQSLPPPVR